MYIKISGQTGRQMQTVMHGTLVGILFLCLATITTGTFALAATSLAPTGSAIPLTPEESVEGDTEEATVLAGLPPAPQVNSPIFVDPETWYNTTEGLFAWALPIGVYRVAIEFATSSENVPSDLAAVYDPAIQNFIINKEIVIEGEQYFSVQFRNQIGWGPVVNRKLRIDTTPPQKFMISVQPGRGSADFPVLRFAATDLVSGVAKYELTVAGKEPVELTPEDVMLGYKLKELENGTYQVKIVAFDRAGNKQVSVVEVPVTANWVKPVVLEKGSIFDYVTVFDFFLIALAGFLMAYIWCVKKEIRLKEIRLRKETKEVREQTEKIFSALRDEIYDQISGITKQKRLTKNERVAVEGLTQALEISETLIEKEIGDVKLLLK